MNVTKTETEWTDEALRIAIAEACGWHHIRPCTCSEQSPRGVPSGSNINERHLPNYPSDLNACHEMEKVLNESQ